MSFLASAMPAAPLSDADASSLIGQWHDFYLLAGTAAATLVGLLFVSLSFNLDVLVHDRNAHLLAHARQTLMDFVTVLMISLVFEVPQLQVRVLGLCLAVFSAVGLTAATLMQLRARRVAQPGRDQGVLRRRRATSLFAYVAFGAIGVIMAIQANPFMAWTMIGFISMLLGNAAGSSWHLLVEVGRLKLRAADESPPS